MSTEPDELRCGANTETKRDRRRRERKQQVRFQIRLLWGRTGYRPWARLLHWLDLHHTRTSPPMDPDGSRLTRCEWCGLARTDYADATLPTRGELISIENTAVCPSGWHTFGWQGRNGHQFCDCGVQLCTERNRFDEQCSMVAGHDGMHWSFTAGLDPQGNLHGWEPSP